MFVELRAGRAWHDFDRRGSRPRSQHAVEDASGVSAVFGPVRSIDSVADVGAGVKECDVLVNTSGPYLTLLRLVGATEPMTAAATDGSDVYVVAVADDPHRNRFSLRALAPN